MSKPRRGANHPDESGRSGPGAAAPPGGGRAGIAPGESGPTDGRVPGDPAAAGSPRDRVEPEPPGDEGFELDENGEPVFVVPIEESLDLHSFQPSEILGVVDAYLDAALERGFREVRLIHGRGKGVQRANVQRSLGRDARVERYADAPGNRGGWGATIAWLRTPVGDAEKD